MNATRNVINTRLQSLEEAYEINMKNQEKLEKVRKDDKDYMDTKLVSFLNKHSKTGTNLLQLRQNRLQDSLNTKDLKEARLFKINVNLKK